jgi:hypothetical protein
MMMLQNCFFICLACFRDAPVIDESETIVTSGAFPDLTAYAPTYKTRLYKAL